MTTASPINVPEPTLGPLKGEKFATLIGFSDSHAYEILATTATTATTVTVRELKAEKDPTWKGEFHVGGFAAHCSNQNSQRWFLQSDLLGRVLKGHLRKDGIFHTELGPLALGRAERFYDYNY